MTRFDSVKERRIAMAGKAQKRVLCRYLAPNGLPMAWATGPESQKNEVMNRLRIEGGAGFGCRYDERVWFSYGDCSYLPVPRGITGGSA